MERLHLAAMPRPSAAIGCTLGPLKPTCRPKSLIRVERMHHPSLRLIRVPATARSGSLDDDAIPDDDFLATPEDFDDGEDLDDGTLRSTFFFYYSCRKYDIFSTVK